MKKARTIREKLDALRAVDGYRAEVEEMLERIIANTYDSYIHSVDKFHIGETDIDVNYWYTCRGESGGECATIPIQWLDEGFDYLAAYRDERKRTARKSRRRT